MPTRIDSSNRPRIPLTDLKGKEIPQDNKKIVSTASHEISLATNQGGQWLPDFKLTRRNITDPAAKSTIIDVPAAELRELKTAADFKTKLAALIESNKSFLQPEKQAFLDSLPEGDRSNFAYINIVGRRNDQFFDEAMKLLQRTGLTGAEATEARKAINLAHRDAFRGRSVDYDKADTGSYWSYGHDAPFTHVFEEMLKSIPDDDPRRKSIQNQLDFIFTHKYVDTGSVRELDCEKSLKLLAIDKQNRHVVSLTKESEGSNFPRYETLQVPGNAGEHANKFVYRDGEKYFFENTGAAVPQELVEKLIKKPAGEIVFRRPEGSEQPRSNFAYDWNGNRRLNVESINTGWWGHCDIKALMETILADMKGSGGVKEFRSDTQVTTNFTRAMQLEGLAALLNFDDINESTRYGGAVRLGTGDFSGGRFDDRPSTMALKTDRGTMNFNVRIGSLSEKGKPEASVNVDAIFSPKIADEKKESFKDNPDIRLDPRDPDTTHLDASGRKFTGTTDGFSFDSMGRPVESKTSFTIDPNVTTGDKVLIGTELTSIEGRKLNRFYYDPATKEISRVPTEFVKGEGGSYSAKESTAQVVGTMKGMELSRENTGGDDVKNKYRMLEEAVRTGAKMATDSDTREQVWNGEVHRIRLDTAWRSPDGKWERVDVRVDATFGSGKAGSFLNKLDDEGKIIDQMELSPAVDFYWRDEPRVAPLISERGNWYVNRSMRDRGVVTLGNEMMAGIGAIQDLNDLIYLGLKSKDNKPVYTIVHEGKRLVYEDEASWKADIEKLKGTTTPEGGPTTVGKVEKKSTPALAIPDNKTEGVADSITVSEQGKVKGIKVDIDLDHTWVGDLRLTLVAPDGTELKLHDKSGGSADNLRGTFGAELKAKDALDALKGKSITGEWKLKVQDLAGQDVGTLKSWGLNLDVE